MTDVDFATWWAALPQGMRLGDKNRARTRYVAILKRGEGKPLAAALDAYKADQGRNPWRHWMYCSTWLGRWETYIPEEVEAIEDEEREFGRHLCDVCPTHHVWNETGDPLNFQAQWLFACPLARQNMKRAIDSAVKSVAAQKSF